MMKSGKFIVLVVLAAGLAMLNSCNKNDVKDVALKTEARDYLALFNAFNFDSEETITRGDEDNLKSEFYLTFTIITFLKEMF
jgi:hypothetical protein